MSRSSPTPELLHYVSQLIAHESAGKSTVPFRAGEKLRQPLCKLVGTQGYRSLMDRALAATRHHTPFFAAFRTAQDGSLVVPALAADPSTSADAEAILVAQFFSLLSSFVGHGVLLTVVASVWPDFRPSESVSAKEKTL
jgi:hypothetical protein